MNHAEQCAREARTASRPLAALPLAARERSYLPTEVERVLAEALENASKDAQAEREALAVGRAQTGQAREIQARLRELGTQDHALTDHPYPSR